MTNTGLAKYLAKRFAHVDSSVNRSEAPRSRDSLPVGALWELTAQGRHGMTMFYPAWSLLYYTIRCRLMPDSEGLLIETGTNRGMTSLVIEQARLDLGADKLRLLTFEIDRQNIKAARVNWKSADLGQQIEIVPGNTLETIPQHVNEPVPFAFIDSCHETNHVLAEVELLLPWVIKAKGLLYFDNTNSGNAAAGRALDILVERHGGDLIHFPNCSITTPGNSIWAPQA